MFMKRKKALFLTLLMAFAAFSLDGCVKNGQQSAQEGVTEAEAAVSDDSAGNIVNLLADYDLTDSDIEFLANILKQHNEGNSDLGLNDEDYYKTELKLAQLGADMGNGELALWVGEIYQGGHVDGLNEVESVRKAFEWWEKAAELGNPRGWTDIGLVYQHSTVPGGGAAYGDIEENPEKAVEYIKKADEAGDMKAPRYLGLLYEKEKNYEKALEYFEKSAQSGDLTSTYYSGKYYLEGIGTETDYAKALEYLTSAAESEKVVPGVADSRYKLASMYEEGLGVEADKEKAEYWYRSAAEEGNEDAAEALKRLSA